MAFPISPVVDDEEYVIRLGEGYSKALNNLHRSTFREQHPSEYAFVYSRGLLNDVCSHMIPKPRKFDIDILISTAAEFSSLRSFKAKHPKFYEASRRHSKSDKILGHLVKDISKRPNYTLEEVIEIVGMYDYPSDLKKEQPTVYRLYRTKFKDSPRIKKLSRKYSKSRISRLPHNLKGVYKLCLNGEIVYIGKADSCIWDRVAKHIENKKFDKVIVDTLEHPLDTALIETCLIHKYSPKYNVLKFEAKSGITPLTKLDIDESMFTLEYNIDKEL